MATTISPGAGRRYGVARVCQVWGLARSSFYAARQPQVDTGAPAAPARRRGPKPAVSDEALLAAIRADLARSPWTGEGHRKVWARLRVINGIRVARKRVLRVMGEHNLLSPHRARTRTDAPHDGKITTTAPNVMWGTDGARSRPSGRQRHAVRRRRALERRVVGWHVAKHGNTLRRRPGPQHGGLPRVLHLSPGVARGLVLRHDHGSHFMSEHFQNQMRFWGIAPSFAFVGEPQTNGVAERFIRTLKEQVVHGRIYQTIEEVREAVRAFVNRYNAEWLAAAFINDPVGKMVCLTLSAIGVYSCSPVFWTLAPNFLTGPSAAVGIAFINSVAALGAFVAPWLIGLLKDATGSYSYGLLMLAALVVAGGVLVLNIKHDIVLEHAPEQPLPNLA